MRRRGAIERLTMAAVLAAPVCAPPLAAQPARETNPPAEQRILRYSAVLPDCSDPAVLGEITWSFAGREREFWASSLALANFERVWETGFRSTGASYIPRRYCNAEALFSDGERRRVVYQIGEALGFLGLGSGVTWCVQGLDRNHAFSPNCRAAGP